MAEARLVPYDGRLFGRYVEAVAGESPIPTSEGSGEARRASLSDESAITRGMLDSETGEFVGYCEIKDTREDVWEIGVVVPQRHWRKGYGLSGVRSLMDEAFRKHGRRDFVARIAPDNEASVRLFQKLGAVPRGIERSIFMPSDGAMRKFQNENPELAGGFVGEMGALFGVEPIELVGRTLVFDVQYVEENKAR